MQASELTTHLNGGLVGLSLAVAVIASYAALDLAQRALVAQGSRRQLWIGAAGVTMGLGIWSMHFIGMLALQMKMTVTYNNLLVLLSLVAAVLGSSISLATVARAQVSIRGVLSAAAFMGFAIGAMHYLGMASMQMAAVIHWNVRLVIVSLAIGFAASLYALWLIVRIRLSSDGFGFARRLLAAVILGVGVAGLHYTAMAASSFEPDVTHAVQQHGLGTSSLVGFLAVGAGIMLAVVIGGAGVDQRRAALASDISLISGLARRLSRIGDARDQICHAIQELASADLTVLVEPLSSGELAVQATAGISSELLSYSQLVEDPHLLAGFGAKEGTFIANLEDADGTASPLRSLTGASSAFFEPLSLDGQSVGVLAIGWLQPVREPPDRTRTLLSMLAAEAAVAIDRETLLSRLEHLSRRDELTGLLNRRVLTEELDRQLHAAGRHDRPLSVVMLDLDHFKEYNDTRGHQAGDQLLKTAATAWAATLRQSDMLVRYGGEEFVVVMPDCTLEAAITAADRLREALPTGTTCSAGVAVLDGEESGEHLILRADQALYEAKDGGRNRTSADHVSR